MKKFILNFQIVIKWGQRKELVDKYGYHNNVKFFSDGSIFVDGRKNKGATGWIVPPHATLDKVLPQANKVYGVLENKAEYK